ncbi:Telomerase protein component 1 [Elasticomyces elasticus]|uniref:phosphatidylinositol-3,4,5-trisphosphate 3-phosphatase n=1 Tax=Exophiala sideris TaxID=1016849 RepID=A0ABR0J8D4_9EURO|nr:Telomerase protein component 1 [Elasticomyces elasticus]KAK5031585.1 Telomerase protein component 1 [Exophiala sideris]KAK5058263.1 Telomerase protein component 1 [Exophiala sideris]KAK5180192.1 Telomerase protein component 1 [Eurotiomycetes sp. CCFEE 6388]
MASLLRQIVAGPRARHPQAGLDLCYVTDYIVVTSGPSGVWPKKAYRNPLDQLVAWLDRKHGQDWTIFEFRAEGTGYPDSEVYNRIHHFPWPDHHPPPFAVMPNLMAAMRNWIQRLDEEGGDVSEKKPKRVAVVHCKAGKGRSGTVACSYLISEEGWKRDDALQRFTERRMRTGFGQGVSIPSQLRYVGYVDRWTNSMGKTYVERPVEILEVHIWGLRDGVKAAIEGFVDNGKKIRQFHTFTREEKNIVEGGDVPSKKTHLSDLKKQSNVLSTPDHVTPNSSTISLNSPASNTETVILKPSKPVILPTSDVNIDFERRNKATAGFTMVTSLAHVWFNCYFEGGYEGYDSGVFAIEWEAMDGIKGSYRKGTKSLDRLKVVWRYAKRVGDDAPLERVITEPAKGEPVPEVTPPNWRGEDDTESKPSDGFDSGRPGGKAITMGAMVNSGAESLGKELGLRKSHPDSTNVSRASSMRKDHEETTAGASTDVTDAQAYDSSEEGVKTYGVQEEKEGRQDTKVGHAMETGLAKAAHIVAKMRSDGYDGNHQG